jgi:hypothetical protein
MDRLVAATVGFKDLADCVAFGSFHLEGDGELQIADVGLLIDRGLIAKSRVGLRRFGSFFFISENPNRSAFALHQISHASLLRIIPSSGWG